MNKRNFLASEAAAKAYQPTQAVLEAARAFTSSATLADLADATTKVGLLAYIQQGVWYRFRAHLFVVCGSTGLVKVCMAGPASPTNFIAAIKYVDFATPGVTGGQQTTLGTAVALGAAITAVEVEIEGIIRPSADGVLSVQGAQSVSNGTATTFTAGAWFDVERIARSILNT